MVLEASTGQRRHVGRHAQDLGAVDHVPLMI
jgi:hypothetical protein